MDDELNAFRQARSSLEGNGLKIGEEDRSRPWGGFLVIADESLNDFIELYFKSLITADDRKLPLSPKILIIKPHARLSWQWHRRRAEIWRIVQGPIQVVRSHDDTERHRDTLQGSEVVRFPQGERHRLVGLNNWGIVAEIWQHTDPSHLSEEADEVRVQDDYGRMD